MAKVYASSTVADLEAERDAVIEWLIAAGPSPLTVIAPAAKRCGTVAFGTWTRPMFTF